MFRFLIGAAFIAIISGAGVARAETYAAARVDIANAAIQLHVIPEARTDIAMQVAPNARFPAISARVINGRLVVDGGLRNRVHGCGSWNLFANSREQNIMIFGLGSVPQHALPTVTLRVPRDLDLTAAGAVFGDVGASAGGRLSFDGCGRMAVDASAGALDVMQNGSGDLDVASVGGALRVRLNGSGDVRAVSAGAGVQAELVGSGNLMVASMSGPLTARLDGSGDLHVGGTASGANLDLQGSGDVAIGAVSGPLRAHLDGSGNLGIASMTGGQADLVLNGSGDLIVNGGTADRLAARQSGSGDIRFHGHAVALDADLGGSGDIYVADAGQTSIRDHGSGSVRVGH